MTCNWITFVGTFYWFSDLICINRLFIGDSRITWDNSWTPFILQSTVEPLYKIICTYNHIFKREIQSHQPALSDGPRYEPTELPKAPVILCTCRGKFFFHTLDNFFHLSRTSRTKNEIIISSFHSDLKHSICVTLTYLWKEVFSCSLASI